MKTTLLLLTLVVVSSCRHNELKEPLPAEHEVAKGEKFRITLPENHDKNEWWTLKDGYNGQAVERLNDVWHGNDKGIDFNFYAKDLGTSTLSFVKKRIKDTLETVDYAVKITDN